MRAHGLASICFLACWIVTWDLLLTGAVDSRSPASSLLTPSDGAIATAPESKDASNDLSLLAEQNLQDVFRSMQTQRTKDIDAFRSEGIVTPAAVQYVRSLERRLQKTLLGPRRDALNLRVQAYKEQIQPWIEQNAAGVSPDDFDRYVKWLAKKRVAERGAAYKAERRKRIQMTPAAHEKQLQYRRNYYQRKKSALEKIPELKQAVKESNRQRHKDWTIAQQANPALWRERKRLYNLRHKTKTRVWQGDREERVKPVALVRDAGPLISRQRHALDLNRSPPPESDEEVDTVSTPTRSSHTEDESIEYLFPNGEPTLETWRQVRILRGALQSRHSHLSPIDFVKSERRIARIEARIAAAVAAKGLSIDDWLLLKRSRAHWSKSRDGVIASHDQEGGNPLQRQDEEIAENTTDGKVSVSRAHKSPPPRDPTGRGQRIRKECQMPCCHRSNYAQPHISDQPATKRRKTKKVSTLYLSPDVAWGAKKQRNWAAP